MCQAIRTGAVCRKAGESMDEKGAEMGGEGDERKATRGKRAGHMGYVTPCGWGMPCLPFRQAGVAWSITCEKGQQCSHGALVCVTGAGGGTRIRTAVATIPEDSVFAGSTTSAGVYRQQGGARQVFFPGFCRFRRAFSVLARACWSRSYGRVFFASFFRVQCGGLMPSPVQARNSW